MFRSNESSNSNCGPPKHMPAGATPPGGTINVWSDDDQVGRWVDSTLLRGDSSKCRHKLVHPIAAAMRTGRTSLFNIRHVKGLGELLVAILAVKDVLGHSGSSRHIIAPCGGAPLCGEKLPV